MAKRFSLNQRQKKHLARIALSAVLTAVAAGFIHTLSFSWWQALLAVLPAYFLIGHDVLWNAIRDIGHGQIFGEKLLMAIATVGALVIGEYVEAVAVLLFFQVGELFESVANAEARRSLSALASLCPDEATVLCDGEETLVPIDEIAVGSEILVKAGERISLDGVIVKGEANCDFSSLTGESVPSFCTVGALVPAGVVALDAPLLLRVEKGSEESATARILSLMEDALAEKGNHERFITKFSMIYTPIVVCLAAVVAFLMPLLADGGYLAALSEYVRRALNFLVVSCPCAVVISVPLSFFSASGRAAKQGIVFKSNAAMERLASCKVACFDKTGTVTSGKFTVMEIIPASDCPYSNGKLLGIAAAVESGSTHPLAYAFDRFQYDPELLKSQKELRGKGIVAEYDGKIFSLGSRHMMEELGVVTETVAASGSLLYLAEDTRYLGAFVLRDTPKDNASHLTKRLKRLSVEGVILSGDRHETVAALGEKLGFHEARGSLLPEDKVAAIAAYKSRGGVIFAGDGINDAPSMAAADVSFAMGALGSDIAIDAADAVICDDDPLKVPFAIALSRFTLRVVRQNLAFAIGIKLLVLVLSAFGYANLPLAIFADVGVLILAILNAMRGASFRHP